MYSTHGPNKHYTNFLPDILKFYIATLYPPSRGLGHTNRPDRQRATKIEKYGYFW